MIKHFYKVIYLTMILLVLTSSNSYANNLDDRIETFQKQDYKKSMELFIQPFIY